MTIHALPLNGGPLVQRVGVTLAHTVWQGLAAAALLRLAFVFVSNSARVRHALAAAALAAVAIAAAVTFAVVAEPVPTAVVGHPTLATAPPPPIAIVAHPMVTTDRPFDVRSATSLAVLAWATGVAAHAAWHLLGWTRVRRLGREPALADARWSAALDAVADRVGVRHIVRLLGSARVDVPVVLGVLRPAIVVPLSLVSELPIEHIEALLAHELAHVRRHDYLANLIQCGVETVFFYHPAVWWISTQVRREREHCCDDVAAGVVGSRSAYAATLVALEAARGPSPRMALAVTGGSLAGRVRRLLVVAPRRPARPAAALVIAGTLCCLLAAAGLLLEATATAQTRPATMPAVATTAPSNAQVLAALDRERASINDQIQDARQAGKLDASPEVVRLRRRLDNVNDRVLELSVQAPGNAHVVPVQVINTATGPAVPHIHVTIGRDGFIAVDGGVGGWVTVRDRLAHMSPAVRATAVVDLVMESDEVPVRELFRAQAQVSQIVHDLGDVRIEVGTTEGAAAPAEGEVYIGGHVPRTGVYSVSHRRITVKQLIISAGGLDEGCVNPGVTIYRRSAGGRAFLLNVPYDDILSGAAPDTYLQPYDVVQVGTAPALAAMVAADQRRIDVLGQVKDPGSYVVVSDRMTIADAIRLAHGTVDGADRRVTLIRGKGAGRQVMHFDSFNALLHNPKSDTLVQPDDLLLVSKDPLP